LQNAITSLIGITKQVPAKDTLWFANRLLVVATSCDERRFQDLWWAFTDAAARGQAFQNFYATGMSRCAVACRAEDVSARSAGSLVLQLIFKLATPLAQTDRLLNGPTNEVWINPWLYYLRLYYLTNGLKVKYFFEETVESFQCDGKQITGVTVRDKNGISKTIIADYYISAIPGDKMKEMVAPLLPADPNLAGMGNLTFKWMNGIQFFLKTDVPMAVGHVMYFDSQWALTSISQQQFWTKRIATNYGDGTINGILSVDISDWDKAGTNGKTAKQCSSGEIKNEVLKQISQHKGTDGKPIFDDPNNVGDWMLDPDITPGNPATNTEPLLVTVKNSWSLRPQAVTKISNFFLASDYVRAPERKSLGQAAG
jgi:hypothetical protein